MHASIRRFAGDPDLLLRAYDAAAAEIPQGSTRVHLCLRAPGGMVLVDTCPTREAFEAFVGSEAFAELRRRHGLPEPERVEDFPVHAAFVNGRRSG
jgi:hypothetical protein